MAAAVLGGGKVHRVHKVNKVHKVQKVQKVQNLPNLPNLQKIMSTIIGLDVGGTKTAILLGEITGAALNIVARREIATQASDAFEVTFERICAEIDAIVMAGHTFDAISVSIGGPLKIEEGIILRTNHLPNWENVRLKDILSARYGVPCHVEHDGNAGALAEFYFGAGRGAQNVIFFTAGTGLGAGLIFNGCIYRGSTDAAGEVGHIRMANDGPVEYQKAGSWEAYCSGAGLIKLAKLRQPGRWPDDLSTRHLVTAAREGNPDAVALIHESGEMLGRGLAMVIDMLNPEVIVLGSLAVALGDLWLGPARAMVRQEAIGILADACRIVPSELGAQIGDYAAFMAAYVQQTKSK